MDFETFCDLYEKESMKTFIYPEIPPWMNEKDAKLCYKRGYSAGMYAVFCLFVNHETDKIQKADKEEIMEFLKSQKAKEL